MRKPEWWDCLLLALCGAWLIYFGLITADELAVRPMREWIWTERTAAWAQAIGTFIAIVGAVAVQSWAARSAKFERTDRQYRAIAVLLAHLVSTVKHADESCREEQWNETTQTVIESQVGVAITTMRSMAASELEASTLTVAFMRLLIVADSMLLLVQTTGKALQLEANPYQGTFSDQLATCHSVLRQLEEFGQARGLSLDFEGNTEFLRQIER